jgi:hypothetical protein
MKFLSCCCVPVNRNDERKQNGLYFRLVELNIEKMEEEIEHDGIIGKLYFFQGISYFWATICQKDRNVTEILTFLLLFQPIT